MSFLIREKAFKCLRIHIIIIRDGKTGHKNKTKTKQNASLIHTDPSSVFTSQTTSLMYFCGPSFIAISFYSAVSLIMSGDMKKTKINLLSNPFFTVHLFSFSYSALEKIILLFLYIILFCVPYQKRQLNCYSILFSSASLCIKNNTVI